MNIVIIAKSYLAPNKISYMKLNDDPIGLYLNFTNSVIPSNNMLFDFEYFINFYTNLGYKIEVPKSIITISNLLETACIETIPLNLVQSAQQEILDNYSFHFIDFVNRNKKIHPILINGYNAIKQNENNSLYNELKTKFDIQTDYNIWGNTTWRITSGIQNKNKNDYKWQTPILDIDIRAQDFSVLFNILNVQHDSDPFTHLSSEINETRNDIKRIAQMLIFGASKDTLLKTCNEENISENVYNKLIEHPIIKRTFELSDTISKVDRLYSFYLNRSIPTEYGKNFSRYIQSSSSDLTLYILSKLEESNFSKYLVILRHDEFIFDCSNFEVYADIIEFFRNLKEIKINKKPILKLNYSVTIKTVREIYENFYL